MVNKADRKILERVTAKDGGIKWRDWEIRIGADPSYSDQAVSDRLGRSLNAVQRWRRQQDPPVVHRRKPRRAPALTLQGQPSDGKPRHSGVPWRPEDHDVAMNPSYTTKEAAAKLGRTVSAVGRYRWEQRQRVIAHHPVGVSCACACLKFKNRRSHCAGGEEHEKFRELLREQRGGSLFEE